jgi:hypothetical protein
VPEGPEPRVQTNGQFAQIPGLNRKDALRHNGSNLFLRSLGNKVSIRQFIADIEVDFLGQVAGSAGKGVV